MRFGRAEHEIERQFGARGEHARTPERRSDGEAPFRGAEIALARSHLDDADRGVEAFECDGEAHVRSGDPLLERPRDEPLESFDGGRRRRDEARHLLAREQRMQRIRIGGA